MLKIIKVGKVDCSNVGSISYYTDEDLHNFDFSDYEQVKYKLTKYRLINSKGQIVSFELKKGMIVGLEILGSDLNRVKEVDSNRFIETIDETPIHSFELDGKNSNCLVEMFTVDQQDEFEIYVSAHLGKIELIFGNVFTANKVGNVILYYDDSEYLSGIKLIDIDFGNNKPKGVRNQLIRDSH